MTTPKPQVLLTDIEGTTSSVDFVHQVLFPYAHDAMEQYVAQHGSQPVVMAILHDAACTVADETGTRPDTAGTVQALKAWIREDRKHTALKAMQGLIWEDGYAQRQFTSHLYDDVAPRLRQWQADGITLGVYSSGSAHAQRLFFAHSAQGDLTPLFSHYFDTTIGQKKEAQSYHNILEKLGITERPQDVLFLSDVPAELDAATQAGMRVYHVVRPGTEPATHPMVHSFDEILFD